MKRVHPKGFTLIELLVVVGIIALLISILLPSLAKARELSRRTACGANMKSLGTSCLVYSEANRGVLPTPYQHSLSGANANTAAIVGSSRTAQDGYLTRTATAPTINNGSNTRGYFKLLMGGTRAYMQPKQFICPSARTLQHRVQGTDVEVEDSGAIVKTWDFDGTRVAGDSSEMQDFSYSMQINLRRLGTGTETLGGPLMNTQDPRKAIAADRNPYSNSVTTRGSTATYTFDAAKVAFGYPVAPTKANLYSMGSGAQGWDRVLRSIYANSRNHNREGQNVVYLDGHAQWQKSSKSGADEDCIWLQQEDGGSGIPIGDADAAAWAGTKYGEQRSKANWLTDSILVP